MSLEISVVRFVALFCINIRRNGLLVVPSGSVFRLCGRLLHISFLDHKGMILSPPSEKWDTKSNVDVYLETLIGLYVDIETKPNRTTDGFVQSPDLNSSMGTSSASSASSSALLTSNNTQYAVFCSSKQARVDFII